MFATVCLTTQDTNYSFKMTRELDWPEKFWWAAHFNLCWMCFGETKIAASAVGPDRIRGGVWCVRIWCIPSVTLLLKSRKWTNSSATSHKRLPNNSTSRLPSEQPFSPASVCSQARRYLVGLASRRGVKKLTRVQFFLVIDFIVYPSGEPQTSMKSDRHAIQLVSFSVFFREDFLNGMCWWCEGELRDAGGTAFSNLKRGKKCFVLFRFVPFVCQ